MARAKTGVAGPPRRARRRRGTSVTSTLPTHFFDEVDLAGNSAAIVLREIGTEWALAHREARLEGQAVPLALATYLKQHLTIHLTLGELAERIGALMMPLAYRLAAALELLRAVEEPPAKVQEIIRKGLAAPRAAGRSPAP
jgi:hypothetical protein